MRRPDRLIDPKRIGRDVAAYRQILPTDPEAAIALLADNSGLDDDTDWEALYFEIESNPQSKQRS